MWGFAGYKKRDEGVAVGFLQGFDIVELDTELNLGWHFKTRRQLLKYYVCYEVNSVGAASTHLQNMYRRFYIHVISMQLMGYLPISELQKLVAQQENLLVPDNQTGHFLSPVFYFFWLQCNFFSVTKLNNEVLMNKIISSKVIN